MKQKKGITLSEIKQVTAEAISFFNVNKYIHTFTEKELISLCQNADPDVFTDISVADNDIVQEHFRWDKVRPKRLSRMMARAIDLGFIGLLSHLDTKGMKFRVKDLKPLLRRKPEMIERFSIDMDKITDVEAHMLLELGKDYFLDHIDVKKRRFSVLQQFDICKSYGFSRKAMLLFDCKQFDGFQTKEALKQTGYDNIDLLDLKNMKLVDWLDLLIERPEMYQRCDILRFKNEPISQLISLAALTDDDNVFSFIKTKDLDEVSPLGWEKLMLHRPDMFESVCDYKKLDALNRKNVIALHPHLRTLIQAKNHST